jgi:acyl-CoA thioester hydrolase
MARATRYRHQVRYFETDQQGVVFNMWYLGYFDEAMTAFLAEGGVAYADLLASGFDVQFSIAGRAEVEATTTYVVVATDGSGPQPIPPTLALALALDEPGENPAG